MPLNLPKSVKPMIDFAVHVAIGGLGFTVILLVAAADFICG